MILYVKDQFCYKFKDHTTLKRTEQFTGYEFRFSFNFVQQILQKICKMKLDCEKPGCRNPIKPSGGCCYICGK